MTAISEAVESATGLRIGPAPESVEMPQLKPTTKGTLEPKTVGRPVLADYPLGVTMLVDMDNVAETLVFGIKLFPHRDKSESYHLAEAYLLGGPAGGATGYMGSLGLFRVDFPNGGAYDVKFDDEIVERIRAQLFPGPKAFK